ncbi:MAG: DUF3276 family protein [Flavobacteriia bacterium]|nr:DUF3276 family protein [Flavobacteriia bacterium]
MEKEKSGDRIDDLFTKVVKAGKRTYFFDIKSTKGGDLFMTITESKKIFQDGKEQYKKHKIFLYKEDFDKFKEGMDETVSKLEELRQQNNSYSTTELDSIDFDSL